MPAATPHTPEAAARVSLRRRLAGGPLARAIAKVDVRLYRALRKQAKPPLLEPISRFSATGQHAAVWLVLGSTCALVDVPRRQRWLRALASVGGTYALNTALKAVVRRKRPILEDLPALVSTPTSLSFPSAHASSSFAAARAYGRVVPGAAPALTVAATAMAVSRVYLGVHYPSDIAAGAALGTAVGSLAR